MKKLVVIISMSLAALCGWQAFGAMAFENRAATYNGYLLSGAGELAGTVQVKAAAAKLDKKTGQTVSKLAISVQPAGGAKKVSIKGVYDAVGGSQTFSSDGHTISLALGESGMSGSFDGAALSGVVAGGDISVYAGVYGVAADQGVFSLTADGKGKVKVAGTTAEGMKVNASALLLPYGDGARVPVLAPKQGLAFLVRISGSKVTVDGLSGAVAGPAGTLRSSAVFSLDGDAFVASLAGALGGERTVHGRDLAEYLPGCAIGESGGKWVVAPDGSGKPAKAGKVAFNKAKDGIDEDKAGENPSGLKLAYAAKNGTFKGSFKAYTLVGGKLKATKVAVSGVLVDGVGHGVATVKKPALSVPVMIGKGTPSQRKPDPIPEPEPVSPEPKPAYQYCVIDLSSGPTSTSYPVSFLADKPSSWTDAYKTTKLVLRYVGPGTFMMGSPKGEVGRNETDPDAAENQHKVTLTRGYWLGVFEVTQKQWELVMGENRSETRGDLYPAGYVSYEDARGSELGAEWPKSSKVDSDSFMGRLRARTGISGFDLPTEAQWEYACRAGTTTSLNSGENLKKATGKDSALSKLGQYASGKAKNYSPAKVGSFNPNNWGFYDMHGNAEELCLDGLAPYAGGDEVDPKGTASVKTDLKVLEWVSGGSLYREVSGSGYLRASRGGGYWDAAERCRSAARSGLWSRFRSEYMGLRVCCTSSLAP